MFVLFVYVLVRKIFCLIKIGLVVCVDKDNILFDKMFLLRLGLVVYVDNRYI